MKSVYCAVRTGSLNKAVCASSLKGLDSEVLNATQSIKKKNELPQEWKQFITVHIYTKGNKYL